MFNLGDLRTSVVEGDVRAIRPLVEQAVREKVPAEKVIREALVPAMDMVGERYERQEYFFPELLAAAKAFKEAMAILQPLLPRTAAKPLGRAVAGTVKGDLHDIGKNMVVSLVEGAGFDVLDLGTDVAPETFAQKARETQANLVLMSALLSTTMPRMRDTIEALTRAGLRQTVKVMIGGAPVNQAYADQIGADGYAPDAAVAVRKAKELVGA